MTPDDSNAQQLFAGFKESSDKFSLLESLIEIKQPENEWLDYKICPMMPGGLIDREKIKAMWSEAICGFANTGGGVLLWGVDAPDEEPIGKQPVFHFEELKTYLEQNVPNATSPPVHGVECLSFLDPYKAEHGYVVCYVPEGRHRPYRAEQQGLKYYHRSGHGFYVIPTPMLRYMFYPQAMPDYQILAKCDIVDGPTNRNYTFTTSVTNVGPGTAEALVVIISSNLMLDDVGEGVSTSVRNTNLFNMIDQNATSILIRSLVDVHPLLPVALPTIHHSRPQIPNPLDPSRMLYPHKLNTSFVLRLYFHSRNSPRRDYSIHFDQQEMNRLGAHTFDGKVEEV